MSGPLGESGCSPLGPGGGGGGGLPPGTDPGQLLVWTGSAWVAGSADLGNPDAVSGLLPLSYIDPAGATDGQIIAFVGGAVQWVTLVPNLTPPVNPTDDGKVPIAAAGNFTYLAPGTAGNALVSSGSAWTSTTDYGSAVMTTLGGWKLGPTGTYATAGAIRMVGRGSTRFNYRNGSPGTADMIGLQFGANGVDDRLVVGDPNFSVANLNLNTATGKAQIGGTSIFEWVTGQLNLVAGVFNVQNGGSISNQGTIMLNFPTGGLRNVQFFGSGLSFSAADRVIGISNRTSAPNADPTNAFYFWSDGGNPMFRYATSQTLKLREAAATASAGAGALPATPQEFLTIELNGNVRKIPCYLT